MRELPAQLQAALRGFADDLLDDCRTCFPRRCSGCGTPWPSFEDYVRRTVLIGATAFEGRDGEPGLILTMANCPCGSTVTLPFQPGARERQLQLEHVLVSAARTTGIPPSSQILAVKAWIREEALMT